MDSSSDHIKWNGLKWDKKTTCRPLFSTRHLWSNFTIHKVPGQFSGKKWYTRKNPIDWILMPLVGCQKLSILIGQTQPHPTIPGCLLISSPQWHVLKLKFMHVYLGSVLQENILSQWLRSWYSVKCLFGSGYSDDTFRNCSLYSRMCKRCHCLSLCKTVFGWMNNTHKTDQYYFEV